MSYESRVEKFRALAGLAGAQTNEAILNAAKAQGYAGASVNGALRHLAQQAGGGAQDDINDAMHAAAFAAGKSSWADANGADFAFDADWSGYDGSQNGTPVDLIASDHRGGWACAVDETRILAVQSEGPNGSADFVARLIARGENKTPLLGDALVLESPAGTVIGTNPYCIQLTPTRYLVTCRIFDGSVWTGKLWLLGLSGETLSLLSGADYVDTPDLIFGLTRHSDTVAVFSYQEAVSNRPHLVAVDVSGDTITQGTPVQADSNTFAASCAPVGLTATTGHFAGENDVFRYTVSGTAITMGNDAAVAGMANRAKRTTRIDDTHSLLMFVDPSGGAGNFAIRALIVTDGTTPLPGAQLTIESGESYSGVMMLNMAAVNAAGTQYLTVWQINGSYAQATVLLVDPDDDFALTKTANALVSAPSAVADHPVCAAYGSSGYACAFWQDEADNQAMGTVILAS